MPLRNFFSAKEKQIDRRTGEMLGGGRGGGIKRQNSKTDQEGILFPS
jgi:hypothetical protein